MLAMAVKKGASSQKDKAGQFHRNLTFQTTCEIGVRLAEKLSLGHIANPFIY